MNERLDIATRRWLAAEVIVIWERSGSIRSDAIAAVGEVNAVRAPDLPPIQLAEVEHYPGQLTEAE